MAPPRAPARRTGPALDAAARACDAVARLFEAGDPNPAVFHLLANELALLDAKPARAGHANQLAFRLKLLVAAGLDPAARRLRLLRRARAPHRLLGRRRRRRLQRLRGLRLPARRGGPRLPRRRARPAAGRGARGRPARAAPGRAGDRRDGRAPRARAAAPGGRRLESRRWKAAQPSAPSTSTTSPRARADMRELLGGKGANVAEMTRVLGRRARARPASRSRPRRASPTCATGAEPEGWPSRSPRRSTRLEEQAGKRLGDPDDPLLVSVRSGARESMPGMLDTVLNLGLNDASVEGLARATGNERFAWDSYRRFVQMFGNVVRGVPGERSRTRSRRSRRDRGVELDTELDVDALRELTDDASSALYREQTGEDFPQEPARAAAPGDPRRVRLLDRRARRRIPAHQPHPRRLGHRGQRPADGVRQQGRRRRAPASRSAATR